MTDNRRMNTIDPGAIVSRAFRIYQEHAAPLLAAAVIVFLIDAVAQYVFDSGFAVLIASLIGLIAHTFYQGVVVKLVDDVRDGTLDSSVGGLFSSVAPVVGVAAARSRSSPASRSGSALFLLIVPGLFLMTIWAVVAPAVVIENRGLDAFGRSQELVKGNGWQVFAVIVIVFLLTVVVGIVGGRDRRGRRRRRCALSCRSSSTVAGRAARGALRCRCCSSSCATATSI